jgi:hypothetical protein
MIGCQALSRWWELSTIDWRRWPQYNGGNSQLRRPSGSVGDKRWLKRGLACSPRESNIRMPVRRGRAAGGAHHQSRSAADLPLRTPDRIGGGWTEAGKGMQRIAATASTSNLWSLQYLLQTVSIHQRSLPTPSGRRQVTPNHGRCPGEVLGYDSASELL